jgi:hypothetical protein
MQSISFLESPKSAKSSVSKRAIAVLTAMLLALAVNTTAVEKADSSILTGALLGGGVGAIFGGRGGAVAGAIAGGLLGGLSKPRKKRRRW